MASLSVFCVSGLSLLAGRLLSCRVRNSVQRSNGVLFVRCDGAVGGAFVSGVSAWMSMWDIIRMYECMCVPCVFAEDVWHTRRASYQCVRWLLLCVWLPVFQNSHSGTARSPAKMA